MKKACGVVELGNGKGSAEGIDIVAGMPGVGAGLNEGAMAAKAGATGGSTVAAGGGMVMISGASGSFVLEA